MSKWSEQELAALNVTDNYPDWVAICGLSKSYDSWESKRRRVRQGDPGEDAAALALTQDFLNGEAAKKAVNKELDLAPVVPHMGLPRKAPAFVGFNFGYYDIEATHLKGNFGRVLCASVADNFGNVVTIRGDDPQYAGRRLRDDSKLVVALRDLLEGYDVLVGWYSSMYDWPYIDTRLLLQNERPLRRDILHIDPIYKARQGSLALHSSRLDAVAKTFRIEESKTPLDPEIWMDAAEGNREAMDYVVQHNVADVLVTRHIFHILKPLVKSVTTR